MSVWFSFREKVEECKWQSWYRKLGRSSEGLCVQLLTLLVEGRAGHSICFPGRTYSSIPHCHHHLAKEVMGLQLLPRFWVALGVSCVC